MLEYIYQLSSCKGIRKTLMKNSFDNSGFFRLFLKTLEVDSKEITECLCKFILQVISPEGSLANESRRNEEVQLIIVFQLEQILLWICEYTGKEQNGNIYSQSRPISIQKWKNDLEFVLELLLKCYKKVQEQLKQIKLKSRKDPIQNEQIIPVVIHRSLSVPVQNQHQQIYTKEQMKEFITKSI